MKTIEEEFKEIMAKIPPLSCPNCFKIFNLPMQSNNELISSKKTEHSRIDIWECSRCGCKRAVITKL